MAKKKGLTIGKSRTALYKSAKVLGDVNAVKRGTITQRVVSRGLGNIFSRLIDSIVRGLFGKR